MFILKIRTCGSATLHLASVTASVLQLQYELLTISTLPGKPGLVEDSEERRVEGGPVTEQ